jgi:hypothetical protein
MIVDAVFFGFCLLVTVAIAVGIYVRHHLVKSDMARIESAWGRYARGQGKAPTAENVARAKTATRNRRAVIQLEASAEREVWLARNHSRGALWTEMSLRMSTPKVARLNCSPRKGKVQHATGDEAFDWNFNVVTQPETLGTSVLAAGLRRQLLAFQQGRPVCLRYERGTWGLSWPGGEQEPSRLDEARAILALASEQLERAT